MLKHGKSQKTFEHNVKTEMHSGKPQKQALAIAYAMKRKAAKKMAEGGELHEHHDQYGHDEHHDQHGKSIDIHHEEHASGYLPEPEEHEMHNAAAEHEDDKHLNQHGESDHGPEDGHFAHGDLVHKIMKKHYGHGGKVHHYSEGGRVANEEHWLADRKENEFDVLPHEDDLEFHYDGKNSGDELGDAREDHDRHDIVSKIMKKMGKQHNPKVMPK